MNSRFEAVGLHKLGVVDIDGERVEFCWATGTGFISAQFTERCPRGIANLDRIGDGEPVVVPLSHSAWLACGEHEPELIRAGLELYDDWMRTHRNRQRPVDGSRFAREGNATEPPDPLLLAVAALAADRARQGHRSSSLHVRMNPAASASWKGALE